MSAAALAASQSKRIGKYEVGNTIGRGGFSKVKRCVDTTTGEAWAMKIVDKVKLQRDNMIHQLQREIALMKSLHHENIVQLKDVMQSTHHVYLVLELVTGGELYAKICSVERMAENDARRYFQQLMMAVLYCHQNGIAHRDIKPQNMLLDANDVVKVSDFGLSNLQPAGDKELLLTLCGTPNYVAPEVIAGEGYNGFLADVWSCGVVLYLMLAGKLPFEDENIKALFNKIERGDYQLSRHFTPEAADLISKMLVVKPGQRYSVDQIIAHPWFMVGMDPARIAASRKQVPQPTEDEERNAVRDMESSGTSAGGGNPASPHRKGTDDGFDGAAPLDGFDVISKITASAMLSCSAADTDLSNPVLSNSARWFVNAGGCNLNTLVEIMQQVKGVSAKIAGTNEIRGFYKAPSGGLVTFASSVHPTALQDVLYFEVRRGRGEPAGFVAFITALTQVLAPHVRS